MSQKLPNTAVKAAPSGRWTLRDKASRSAPYLQRSQTKTATPMATGRYKRNTGCLYSRENLLVCGAQFARTHNTLVFMRTRKPRSVERQKKPPAGFGFLLQWAESSLAALFVRERLIRTDTAHCVSGFAPFGGAAQFERWASR